MSDITLEPRTFYTVVARDVTEDCPNSGGEFKVPELYSNAGTDASVSCGLCKQPMQIVAAERLEPQPEMP
ncbi:hypothetical protein [Streptomyces sp. NPDC048252]|uniref:hypothetical protein n=1 Tax=Streptomyces sp. NPDC048252 TaxID=3154612 RepID=UPI00342E408D